MQEALGLGLLDLPPELRALGDFLAVDHRPSAILLHAFKNPQIIDCSRDTVWLNAGFQRLSHPHDELSDLRQALERTFPALGDGLIVHERVLEGGRWHVRMVGKHCVAVQTDEMAQSNGVRNGHLPAWGIVETKDHENMSANGQTSNDERRDLDWTRQEIPSMTPWIRWLRDLDWAATGVGPLETWSPLLRQWVLSIMSNPEPRLLIWGESWTFIYNEACVQLFGKKHPAAMGKHVSMPWSESWEQIRPLIAEAYNGKVQPMKRLPLAIERKGFLEESYWDTSLTPIVGSDGKGLAVYDELTEQTLAVTGERRRATLNDLSEKTSEAKTLQQLWAGVLEAMESATLDIAFAMVYDVVDDGSDAVETDQTATDVSASLSSALQHRKCNLAGTVGISEHHVDVPKTFALLGHLETGPAIAKACIKAWKTNDPVFLTIEDGSLPSSLSSPVPGRSFDDPIKTALVSAIRSTSGDVLGLLCTGLNTRCAFVDEYKLFFRVTTDFIEKTAALISLPEEQRRAQKISEEIHDALTQQLRLSSLKAERSEARFSRLASTAPTGMFMFDADGKPLYVNDTCLQLLDDTRDAFAARRNDTVAWRDQIHEDDLEHFAEMWQQMKEQRAPVSIEYRLKKPWRSTDKASGQEMEGDFWLLATAFPEIESDGSITAIQGWLTDISHRKFSENLISQRLEDALENKRQTENFIDMTSHEMRNPLSAILQSADAIVSTLTGVSPMLEEDTALSASTVDELVDTAQTIILCAQHQKRIVDDILTLSKLDASLLVISPDKVQVPTLITKALKMYEAEIERASIDASLCMESSYAELGIDWVVLDPSRFLQVVINLLTNSIKFTQYSETRKIRICLGASYQKPTGKHHGIPFVPPRHTRAPRTPMPEWDSGEEVYLQVAVYDTGRGLSEDEMMMLFQRFQQASPKTYKQYGGSGLGLFISRELCELQGGQIGVASQDSMTVFTFFVKAKRWLSPEEERARPPLKSFASASASPMVFSRRGSTILPTNVGSSSPAAEQSKNRCDELSKGHEASKAESNNTSVVVVPQPKQTKAKADASGETPTDEAIHVLIVEDNLINQKVMSQQLRRAGCTVHVANHGMECLEFLDTSTFCGAGTPLSIVLLDLEMPILDGLSCIKHIRERQRSGNIRGHVPVIAVTANARSEQISFAIEAGMDQVVTKPFRIPDLVPQMKALISDVARRNAEQVNGT